MLRLALETAAAGGYIIGSMYHSTDLFDIPIPMVGLAWLVAVRFMPPAVPSVGLFWVTYALLVYQLISFHDFNACFLEECKTSEMYSYIAVISTGVFWASMSDKNSAKYEIKPKAPKLEPKLEPKVELPAVEKEIFPALKIRIQQENKPKGPVRLNMGQSLQPKWV